MTDPKEDLERDASAAPEDEGDNTGGDLSYDEVHVPDEDPGQPERIEPTD